MTFNQARMFVPCNMNAYVKCFAPSHLKIISDHKNPASFAVLREMLLWESNPPLKSPLWSYLDLCVVKVIQA